MEFEAEPVKEEKASKLSPDNLAIMDSAPKKKGPKSKKGSQKPAWATT